MIQEHALFNRFYNNLFLLGGEMFHIDPDRVRKPSPPKKIGWIRNWIRKLFEEQRERRARQWKSFTSTLKLKNFRANLKAKWQSFTSTLKLKSFQASLGTKAYFALSFAFTAGGVAAIAAHQNSIWPICFWFAFWSFQFAFTKWRMATINLFIAGIFLIFAIARFAR